jgi:hypothetical protein
MKYTKQVRYLFNVAGFQISGQFVRDNDDVPQIHLEETRKNGQEDTHMSGVVECVEGGWVYADDGAESFDTYGDSDLANAILDYLDENPFPGVDAAFRSQR